MRALACLLAALSWLPSSGAAEKPVPAAPQYYVLDEPGVLSQRATQALQNLALAHDQATGEQVVVAIFKGLDGEDLVQYTTRVFQTWRIGQRGKDNGVLLALYWNDRKARIEVGYGLEPLLTDARSKAVLEDFLIPALKDGQPDVALMSSAREILRIIESPVLQNAPDNWKPEIRRFGQGTVIQVGPKWAVLLALLIIGAVLLGIFLFIASMGDAVVTRAGWHRTTPWRRGGWGSSSGGGWGGGFGGGGFSGGGGRSGGGGASGSW